MIVDVVIERMMVLFILLTGYSRVLLSRQRKRLISVTCDGKASADTLGSYIPVDSKHANEMDMKRDITTVGLFP